MQSSQLAVEISCQKSVFYTRIEKGEGGRRQFVDLSLKYPTPRIGTCHREF